MSPPTSGKRRRRVQRAQRHETARASEKSQQSNQEERGFNDGDEANVNNVENINISNGMYEIARGRSDAMSVWKTMSLEEKKQLISIDERSILQVFERITYGKIKLNAPPSSSTVMWVQAGFLQAMEANNGVMTGLTEISIELLCIILTLEDRLLFAVVKRDIHRKSTFLLLFFIWRSRFPWIGLLTAAFVILSKLEPCKIIRNAFCDSTDFFFLLESNPIKVEWKSHSLITGFLLLCLSTGAQSSIIAGVLTGLPFVLSWVEDITAGGNRADKIALQKLRYVISFSNKLVLVYFSWSSYSSLFLVALLFFADVAIYCFSVAFLATGVAISMISSGITRLVPLQWRLKYLSWKQRGYNSIILALLPIPLAIGCIAYTWEWSAPWGGVARAMTTMVLVQVLPPELISFAWQLALLALSIPIYLAQFVPKQVPIWINQTFRRKAHKEDGRSYNFDYDAYMNQN